MQNKTEPAFNALPSALASVRELSWRQRWTLLIGRLNLIPTEDRVETEILGALARPARPTTLAFINAHAMNSVVHDARFADTLLAADMLLRDGSGMRLLLKLTGRDPGLNLNGTDLIPRLIGRFAGRGVALFGTVEPYLGAAARRVEQDLAPGARLLRADGFQPEATYLDLARRERPGLIVLGMGMPKQEAVARILRAELAHPCLIVCGGAIIDFLGGRVERAPGWSRALGMEWAFRLLKEPRRLFRRYVLGNPVFIARALVLVLRRRLGSP